MRPCPCGRGRWG